MNEVIRSRTLITCVREDAVDLGRVLEPPSGIFRICLEEPLNWGFFIKVGQSWWTSPESTHSHLIQSSVRVQFLHLSNWPKMADKEATVFILDLGASMAQKHSGREESDLDWAMCYVWDKITDIVAANRKTLCVGVVGLRTDETNNRLQDGDGYENISVIQELSQITMSGLRALKASVKPNETMSGDAVSAIVVAIDLIGTFTKKLKWIRNIVLVTDGQGDMDADDIEDIAKKINDSGIKLTVL